MNSGEQSKHTDLSHADTSVVLTTDGSHTLYVPKIDECYHSTHGAIQESQHIFIETALKHCKKPEIRILEIGFGTGLNALLTFAEAEKSGKKIFYHSLEKYPVSTEKALQLNYSALCGMNDNHIFEAIHKADWNCAVNISENFTLEKTECDFTEYDLPYSYDVIYFDAFSPEKQPEMWSEDQFAKVFAASENAAILSTYCAKGWVRRAMQTAGFKVERLPGPPGKREILRATKEV